jgi:regulator of ribosome biosynthesis
MTKWQQFAAKKGIKDKKKDGKMVYDEDKGEWVPKWGYKGANKKGEGEWLVEVDEKKEREQGLENGGRGEGRRERKEKVRRNERKERSNEKRAAKTGGR